MKYFSTTEIAEKCFIPSRQHHMQPKSSSWRTKSRKPNGLSQRMRKSQSISTLKAEVTIKKQDDFPWDQSIFLVSPHNRDFDFWWRSIKLRRQRSFLKLVLQKLCQPSSKVDISLFLTAMISKSSQQFALITVKNVKKAFCYALVFARYTHTSNRCESVDYL